MSETTPENDIREDVMSGTAQEVIPPSPERLWNAYPHPTEAGKFIGFLLDEKGREHSMKGRFRETVEGSLARFKHFYDTRDLFLDAWKRGVKFCGRDLFENKSSLEDPETIQDAVDKNQLAPNQERINEQLLNRSSASAAFLAAMCSYYNHSWGKRLMEQTSRDGSFCDVTSNLDRENRQTLADLIVGYKGW